MPALVLGRFDTRAGEARTAVVELLVPLLVVGRAASMLEPRLCVVGCLAGLLTSLLGRLW